ncbi:MAG: diacylglycerol kinase family lipid kinase [Clostridia bacterium]|nr:diacylglycerol kinase family lipid kinase [Clostridia bacterium]
MYHIIFNPVAGKKKAVKNLRVVEKMLTEQNIPFFVHQTNAEHDAEEIAHVLTKDGADLIVLGGDGTLHEVLNGIVDPSLCRLGLIPSGTGNDFAEKAGIPLEVEKATHLILNGRTKPTDYLEVGGVRCMNVAGLGMDVDVLERCKKGKMKGKMKYLLSLLQSLFAFKGYRIEVQSEGRQETRDVLIAAACNGSQFGGGIAICPTAEIDDGKISVVVVDCIGGKWKIIKAFMQLMKGRVLQYPATTHFVCDSVRFLPEKPCTVQLDGELYKDIPFDVKIKTGLNIFR